MPFSSKACQTCKLRRIKCDETKPVCLRCTKARRICLKTSVIEEPGFSINLENAYASGQLKRPRGPRSSLTLLRPRFDLEARAVAYFLQHHVLALTDLPDVSQSLCGCIATWRASGRESAMVDLALSATSLAVFSRTNQGPQAAIEASSRYGRLLRTVQEHIAHDRPFTSGDRDNIDACLLTMFLMGRYEATMHNGSPLAPDPDISTTASLQRWFHHDGALNLLQVWIDSPSPGGPIATTIIKLGRRGLIRSSLRQNFVLTDWILDGALFGEQGLELEYDRILIRAVKLHQVSAELCQQDNITATATLLERLDEAQQLDHVLQDWITRLPSEWSYSRHTLAEPAPGPWPRRFFFSSIVYTFATAGYASVWAQYFATRMLINNARLRLLRLCRRDVCLGPNYGQQQHLECSILLTSMADRLAFTLPFCLGMVRVSEESSQSGATIAIDSGSDETTKPYLAALVIWELTVASSLDGIDLKQQQWFRSELAHIGRRIGNGILETAETAEWPML